MAKQQMIGASSSSSSSSSSSFVVSPEKYDVFLSFRGEDTRANFTSYLYDALTRNQVKTFIDNEELEKGDEISLALIEAIEESHASIIIFSENYATSKWCLNELIKILECNKDRGHIVIPVFHNINPSHMRKQTGSYKRAFVKHERDLKHDKDKLQTWKDALTKAAGLAGWCSQNYRTECDLIKDIVEDVLQKLKHRYHPFEVKGLVGIEKKCEEIESLFLKIWSNDVRIVVIWGMGGIGKTTLAKALCAKLSSQFKGYCFLENVREESIRHGLIVVRHRLFSALLGEKNLRLDAPFVETPSIMRRLARKKVFVVLDDVADSEQIEDLFINNNCLGPGSRVIVTTRDKQICSKFDECEIYEVKGLNKHDSLQLFCLNAFKEKHPKNGYEELSECVIGYCKGNPLALKVLGANLRTKSKEAWKDELKKLQEIPNKEIHSVLKLSYDDLDRYQQDIFLDIACFAFYEVIWFRNNLTSLFEACRFFAASGIEVLQEKALITISEHYNEIAMHDLIKEMGREIVIQKSKDPGKRSRLWKFEEVYDVLKNNKGTGDVEVISFDITKVENLYLSSDSFKGMTNLRFLEIYVRMPGDRYEVYEVHFPDGLGWLSDKLRYLRWDAFPLESLPSTFCAKMLVELHMKYSKLKKLWDGVQNVSNLKIIDLDGSTDLIEVPDLSMATNLESVSLRECVSLRELYPSIFSLAKLTKVDLKGCIKIESLKSNIHSKSLNRLYLNGCSSLTEFSVTSEEMSRLRLDGTAIRELSSSIWRNSKLTDLDLSGCDKLNASNNGPGLGSLTRLELSGCTQINASNLWFILDGMRSLNWLRLRECCNLEALPDNIRNHSMLEELELDDCRKLVFSLTELPPSLLYLTAPNCTYLDKDSTQCPVLENVLQTVRSKIPRDESRYHFRRHGFSLLLPGGQVPGKFDFHITTEGASITIPPIPKSDDLCGFVFYIILSEGFDLSWHHRLCHRICTHGKLVDSHFIPGLTMGISKGILIRKYYKSVKSEELISDHVFLSCYSFNKEQSGSDLYNGLSFEFKLQYDDKEPSTEGIKGCGVLPVYALERGSELDGNSSRQKIVELESGASAQVFDIGESQPTATGGHEEVGGSINETEHDQQQPSYSLKEEEDDDWNDKSSCNCSIESGASAQVFDIGESQPTATGGHEEVGGSINETEHDQQQPSYSLTEEEDDDLNEKSSCNCSIGLLLKHLLGGSKQ